MTYFFISSEFVFFPVVMELMSVLRCKLNMLFTFITVLHHDLDLMFLWEFCRVSILGLIFWENQKSTQAGHPYDFKDFNAQCFI